MRYRTKAIELEAVKYEGHSVPDFAKGLVDGPASGEVLVVNSGEGLRDCRIGDYLLLTEKGQVLVRAGPIFEAIFEPAV